MESNFDFTRAPSTKTRARTELATLAKIDNTLVIIGKKAAEDATAPVHVPYTIENFGDEVAALAECTPLFGAASECTLMVKAAIEAIKYGTQASKNYPTIKVIPVASDATGVAAALAANIALPMPFLAVSFAGTVTAVMNEVKDHLNAISGEDKGRNGQFGSFGFMGLEGSLATSTPVGLAAASEKMLFPWLRDTSEVKANKVYELAASLAAVCASNGQPYNPLNELELGKRVAPAKIEDYHVDGDTGTVALGLAAGLVPLVINSSGKVAISRTVTSFRPSEELEATAYYDMQDWQKMYSYRTDCYARANEERYKRTGASDDKIKALGSEFKVIAKTYETLGMFQYVDKLINEFVVKRHPSNRHAAIYTLPVNVIPGFHNKGIDIVGTNKYDSFII